MFLVLSLVVTVTLIVLIIVFLRKQSAVLATVLSIIVAVVGLVFISQSIVVVDAGETGVIVLFGTIDDRVLGSGLHFINPLAKVVKYPTRLQEYTAKDEDIIEVRAADGLKVSLDLSILYSVDANQVVNVYRSIAKDVVSLEERIFKPTVRTVIRNIAANYLTDEIYSSKREELSEVIQENVESALADKGTIIDSVLIRKIVLPATVDDAIQAKLTAQQESEAMQFRKTQAEQQAEIKIIEARGLAEAQQIINSTLTPSYLQYEAIEAYRQLANSQNTTFVIMPTSTEGAGMPLILGAP
jgi:regulator of protease activity HflC (stomatin/prohibitin superfamily)